MSLSAFLRGLLIALAVVFVIGVYLFGNSPESVGLWVRSVFTAIGDFFSGIAGNGNGDGAVG